MLRIPSVPSLKRSWSALIPLVFPFPSVAQGVLDTQPGISRSTQAVEVEFGPAVAAPVLRLSLGFASDEVVRPGEIPDSFTVTLQDAAASLTVIWVTMDVTGTVWAPITPGTTPIGQDSLVRSTIPYPSLTPTLAYQQSFDLEVRLPQNVVGRPLTVYFDLFNNDNGVASQAWFSQVRAIPEPATVFLGVLGIGWLGWVRRRVSLRAATSAPAGSVLPNRSATAGRVQIQ